MRRLLSEFLGNYSAYIIALLFSILLFKNSPVLGAFFLMSSALTCIYVVWYRIRHGKVLHISQMEGPVEKWVMPFILWAEDYMPPEVRAVPIWISGLACVGLLVAVLAPQFYLLYMCVATLIAVLVMWHDDEKECRRVRDENSKYVDADFGDGSGKQEEGPNVI